MNETTQLAPRKAFSRIGLGFAVFIILIYAVTIAAQTLLLQYAEWVLYTGWITWVISYVPMYCIAFPVMLLIWRTIPNSPQPVPPEPKAKMSAKGFLTAFIVCIGLTYSLNILSTLLAEVVANLKGAEVHNTLGVAIGNSDVWLSILVVVIIAPVMEEIIFRHLMYKKMVQYGGKAYILTSAMMFSLFHMNLYQLFYAFVLGVLFGAITYYTGTAKYTILLHMAINFIGSGVTTLLMTYAPETVFTIWAMMIYAGMIAGLIVMVVWLRRHRKEVVLYPGVDGTVAPASNVLLNIGMGLFLLITLGLTVANMLA